MTRKAVKGLRKVFVFVLSFILMVGMVPVDVFATEVIMIPFSLKIVRDDGNENAEDDIPIPDAAVAVHIQADAEGESVEGEAILEGKTDENGIFTGQIEPEKIPQDSILEIIIEHESYKTLIVEHKPFENGADDINIVGSLELVIPITAKETEGSEPAKDAEETEETEAPKETEETEAPKETEETEAPKETEETEAPKETEETEAPKETEETEAPKETEETEAPKETEETEAPKETEETEAPKETEETEAPKETEETEAPKDAEETEAPKETEETPHPHEHKYDTWAYDNDNHWLICACDSDTVQGKEPHEWVRVPEKDTDTKYAYKCECGVEGVVTKTVKETENKTKATETQKAEKETEKMKAKVDSPATGDDTNIWLGTVLAVSSLGIMIAMIIMVRKKEN